MWMYLDYYVYYIDYCICIKINWLVEGFDVVILLFVIKEVMGVVVDW